MAIHRSTGNLVRLDPTASTTRLVNRGDGFAVTDRMRHLLDLPVPLKADEGGQALRILHKWGTLSFNPEIEKVSQLAQRCYRGNIQGVRELLHADHAPDLSRSETAFKHSYIAFVILGAQKPRSRPSGRAPDYPGTLRLLLERGAPPTAHDVVGYTPLHLACMKPPRADFVRLLLEHGADVNAQDRFGSVAITSAMQNGDTDVIEVLMEHGADLDVEDADGVTPEEFYVKCGSAVIAVIQKWKRKRQGVEAALEDKTCAMCQRSDVLKYCNGCHAVRYCSKECQREDWPYHKTRCIPFNADTTVTVTPFYQDIGEIVCPSDLMRQACGYSVTPQHRRNSRSMMIPVIRRGEVKRCILKIQVPLSMEYGVPIPDEEGDMMVFDKKRTIVCRIRKVDDPAAYVRLSRTIRSKGTAGNTAYFNAEMRKTNELVIKIAEVLAEQSF